MSRLLRLLRQDPVYVQLQRLINRCLLEKLEYRFDKQGVNSRVRNSVTTEDGCIKYFHFINLKTKGNLKAWDLEGFAIFS